MHDSAQEAPRAESAFRTRQDPGETGPAPPAQTAPPPPVAARVTGPAGLTAEDWNLFGLPVAEPRAPSWMDDTPDWHPA